MAPLLSDTPPAHPLAHTHAHAHSHSGSSSRSASAQLALSVAADAGSTELSPTNGVFAFQNDNASCDMSPQSTNSLPSPSSRDGSGNGRGSFSSVREDELGPAQSFTCSKTSAFSYALEEAIVDSPVSSSNSSPAPPRDTLYPLPSNIQDCASIASATAAASSPAPAAAAAAAASAAAAAAATVTCLDRRTHTTTTTTTTTTTQNADKMDVISHVWQPATTFRGWKEINLRGKYASKSFSDLQLLNMIWAMPEFPTVEDASENPGAGHSRLELLPIELLGAIIDLLYLETPTNSVTKRNADLIAVLNTSRTLHVATLQTLYRKITIPHSKIFRKFLTAIQKDPFLGTIVQRLDFNHFNPNVLFLTGGERSKAQNLTKDTLLQCLELTPNVREFLAQEHIVDDISPEVINKLFFGLERMQAIDFAGCSGRGFKQVWDEVISDREKWSGCLSVKRLSFHKCMILPPVVYETIFPCLGRLTHLDVSSCRVTDQALLSIPNTARLTHLSLAKCGMVSAESVLNFIANHPSVRDSLVVLNVATDATSHQMFNEDQVSKLLTILPRTLRSLNLKGARMAPRHIDQLLPIVPRLEELGIGRGLTMRDVGRLLCPEKQLDSAPTPPAKHEPPTFHQLRYIDVSDMYTATDLDYLFTRACQVLSTASEPLQVIELSENVAKRMRASHRAVAAHGWAVSEEGARSWLVRKNERQSKSARHQEAYRWWKMGATYWGTRKLPMADCEVGGMYGSFMFARKL
ncbi:hypothetical protein TD95_002788 [Thielaviopsis punctulata]|uniref:F-box domain-containing protein n=1 Tax=Thielaviopsis punctulata TaxID=72032 RepID=A0A0F4ZER7_9PEZI|nr:hypothetical protein TD95_002788 [Thielaviopsis punctulata]